MRTFRLRVGGVTGDRDRDRLVEALADLGFVRSVRAEPLPEAEEVEVQVRISDVRNDLREAVESLGYTLLGLEPS